ncbi:glycosyltransferase involved in cell wall biosynthesis [Arcicella aurantiaca]|uniref:Glycosyltransferase involved in cell wall biosynthesis n=1 Tax=Arcicella aurantiaca TaxID=591202 RepID=A0A316E9C4_9BACT|nr:glycosyltransferase family 2 protein [Arcicella aurantiaca]PWK26575.1 glycosyltransferase involved in cell wall biosynthesis [Arcicella aurantiaca]
MIKVSVIVHTYNHENYIRQTLDSILNQQVNFEYEVIVGDDASPDSTPQIIKEYQQKFPQIIKPMLHPKNLGGFGKNNTLATLSVCKGQYIAAMDGDDYWTNPLKLQKQVDFLDNNADFVACFHNALIHFEDGSHPDSYVNDKTQRVVTSIEDLVGEDEIWYMATSAVMFRNGIMTHYPKWFHESKSGDIPRYILLGKHGKFYYIDEVMSVYRKNGGGMSFTDGKQDADFLFNRIGMYKGIDGELNYKFHKTVNKNIARYYLMLANSIQYGDNFFLSRFYALKSLYLSRPNANNHLKEVLQDYIIPKIFMKIYANVKWQIKKLF